MAKKLKDYRVLIDMQWSEEYHVKAGSAAEAKRKGWAKFKSRTPRKNFTITSDKV